MKTTQARLKARLRELLNSAGADYPKAWRMAESWRQDRGSDLPDWPDYCFFPMAGWYAAICDELQVSKLSLHYALDISRLAALGAWRYTQSVYRINSSLYQALIQTVPRGQLPVELLMRLPEWCVYIETPGLTYAKEELQGFFAHLEWDANRFQPELRLLLVKEKGLEPVPLHLGGWTITEAVDRANSEARKNATKQSQLGEIPDNPHDQAQELYPLISLLLYVCSDGVEYQDRETPANPALKRTKKGLRLFPASRIRVWNLGDKTGKNLERLTAMHSSQGERKGPKPHIRRAHWHTFYAGPRNLEKRETRVKWIPPLLVASSDEED